jgi:hypothetical protein
MGVSVSETDCRFRCDGLDSASNELRQNRLKVNVGGSGAGRAFCLSVIQTQNQKTNKGYQSGRKLRN